MEEAPEELRRPRLGDLGDEVRRSSESAGLPTGRRSSACSTPSATSLKRSYASPSRRPRPPREPASGSSSTEEIDEEIDGAGAVQVAEELRDADESERLLLRIGERARCSGLLAERGDERVELRGGAAGVGARRIRCVELARRSLGVEEGG